MLIARVSLRTAGIAGPHPSINGITEEDVLIISESIKKQLLALVRWREMTVDEVIDEMNSLRTDAFGEIK